MKSLWTLAILILATASLAIAAPVGICLHAYSPEAPADKIECFEFESFERFGADYRFFIDSNKPAVVTSYRYRGTLLYKTGLAPGNPEFDKLLKLYEETSRASPSTRRYLNPKILVMRDQAAGYTAAQQHEESLPKISVGGENFLSPQFKGIEDGKLVLGHKDGVVKIDIEKITDSELQALAKIDPKAAKIKVLEIAKSRLWNPRYQGLSAGNVGIAHEKGVLSLDVDSVSETDLKKITQLDPKFGENKIVFLTGKKLWNPSLDSISSTSVQIKHEKGILPLEFDTISEKDKKTIMSWSDGTWKIGKPGFYKPKSGDNSYGELILENGRFHTDVQLTKRVGESITLKTSKLGIKLPIRDLATIPGLTAQDSAKIETWATEIVDERLSRATPEASTKVISTVDAEVLTVTDVRVLILQVLDQGVLASKFIGILHKGTERVQTTKTVTVEHPVTGAKISKVVDTSINDFEVTEDVTDDLCYIVGNTKRLVDGETCTADSMKLLGRYQYNDVTGRPRTVRKYHVD
jgi:hypothetical protein